MYALRLMAAVVLALGLGAGVRAQDKIVKGGEDIVNAVLGTWEVTKADEGALPAGSLLVLEQDGKVKITHKMGDKDITMNGTYKVEGVKLTMTVKVEDKENIHKVTVKYLTDTELVAVNEQGKKIECKKKKK
jgi:uncharacterized protein (TIGR03066 family)